MDLVLAFVALIIGFVILYFSSDLAVDRLISLATILGASLFSVGFIISSIGSDLPEIVNGIISAYLGHGDISVGDSFGSINTQISLVLGLIPFFCTFCRLIPRTFAIVGFTEVGILILAIVLSADGFVSRFDGIILIILWGLSIFIIQRFGEDKVAVEDSDELIVEDKNVQKLIVAILLSFIGIGVGSYLVVESVIAISEAFGVSEYLVSFFFLSLGTSLPELIVAISAIRKRHFELAVGDIIGSCIVDATLAIGIGPALFPIVVNGSAILLTGLYAVLTSAVVVIVLSYRMIHDRKSGLLFLILYLSTWIIPLFL
jgi:cation:H+ antiporter